MRYKLFKENPQNSLEQVLENRGIPQQDYIKWVNADWDNIYNWKDLIQDTTSVYLVNEVIKNNKKASLIIDCDVDGLTSAAIFVNYFYKIAPEWVENMQFIHHSGKQHGLSDTLKLVDEDTTLLVCPDSSSNDYEQHEQFASGTKYILILDHHEAPKVSEVEHVYTINNQLCDYPNKALSGAGVVWKFCQAYDELFGYNYADDFMDLTAVGLAADMMNFTSLETRSIINAGLKNLNNEFLKAIMDKNEYTMNKHGGHSYMGVAFGVSNFMNSVCRVGTLEEKQFVFESMLDMCGQKLVENSTRGHKGEMIYMAEEAVQICTNTKRRQTVLQDEGMRLLENKIKKENLLKNAVLIICIEPGDAEREILGLVANKLQAKYQRPCFVLMRSKTKDDKEYYFRGSARNYSMSEIEDLRTLCEESGLGEYFQGHGSAFGSSVSETSLTAFQRYLNDKYTDIPNEPTYVVDFEWKPKEVDDSLVLSIGQCGDWWGTGMPEPYIAIKDIVLSSCNIVLMGQNKNTIKITLPNGLPIIQFNVNEEIYNSYLEPNKIMTIVGKCNANEWNGKVNPQILMEDCEIREEWVF